MLRVGFMIATEDCHNHCVFCDATRLGTGRILPRDKMREQLEYYLDVGVDELVISGGEPLHHPDLLTTIERAKLGGIGRISLYTTACFELTQYTAQDLIAAGTDCFMVSLFGPNERIHNAVARNATAFSTTMRGLAALAETKTTIVGNSPVMRANYRYLLEMLEVLVRHRVSVWQLSDLHPTTAVLQNINVHVPYEDLQPLLRDVMEAGEAKGVEVMAQEYPLCILGENYKKSQEICRAWYTMLFTEATFGSGDYAAVPPISAPRRAYLDDCQDCSLKSYCRGVPESYIARHPLTQLVPYNEPQISELAHASARSWLMRNRVLA